MVTENRKINIITLKPKPITEETLDELALDEPTCIFINGEYHVTLISSPRMKKELAVGYLISEAIIHNPQEIRSIRFRENDVYIDLEKEIDLREISVGMMNLIVTACSAKPRSIRSQANMPKVSSTLQVKVGTIFDMIRKLNQKSDVHLRTRGTHAAMACTDDGEVLAFAEDVGRHNAVDKVIGSLALKQVDSGKCVLLSTGRQSGEMVQKAARGGIPVVASMTVPLISGVRLAEVSGVTLASIGKGKLKVYTNAERIML